MSTWTYGRTSNRLSEDHQYLTNGGGGNTPILDVVNLGVGGTRDYIYGLAGHLEEVAVGANVIDFAGDAEGRLAWPRRLNTQRWYETGAARYARKDPVGNVEMRQDPEWYPRIEQERFSLYNYVDANPVSLVDPLGNDSIG